MFLDVGQIVSNVTTDAAPRLQMFVTAGITAGIIVMSSTVSNHVKTNKQTYIQTNKRKKAIAYFITTDSDNSPD